MAMKRVFKTINADGDGQVNKRVHHNQVDNMFHFNQYGEQS